jgi:hypothetical protein
MAHRLHKAEDHDLYHTYDPDKHYETTVKKIYREPDA